MIWLLTGVSAYSGEVGKVTCKNLNFLKVPDLTRKVSRLGQVTRRRKKQTSQQKTPQMSDPGHQKKERMEMRVEWEECHVYKQFYEKNYMSYYISLHYNAVDL